jgi:hypothetical protein
MREALFGYRGRNPLDEFFRKIDDALQGRGSGAA